MQFTLLPLDPIRISHITTFFQLCSVVHWDCLALTFSGCFPRLQFFAQEQTFVNCTFNLAVSEKIKKSNAHGYCPTGSLKHSDSPLNTSECSLL